MNGGGTVKTPADYVNTSDIVPASWVWKLIRRYGLAGGINTAVDVSDVYPSRDLNDVDATGFYTCSNTVANSPKGEEAQTFTGLLIHVHRRFAAGPVAWQMCVQQTTPNVIFYRVKNGSVWSEWFKIAQDNDVVHLSGSETIEGTKEFAAGLRVQNFITYGSGSLIGLLSKPVSFPKGSNSNADEGFLIRVLDSSATSITDKLLAEIAAFVTADGSTVARLSASNNSAGQTGREFISITFDKTSGTYKTHAPTPVTSSHFLRSKSLRNSVSSEVRSPCAWHKGCSSSCARKSPWLMGNRDLTRHYQHILKNSRSRRP